MRNHLSPTALSNLFTMGIAARKDPRQKVPNTYQTPPEDVRVLRARLILEEALEACVGLGVLVCPKPGCSFLLSSDDVTVKTIKNLSVPNLEKIIDGCCDTIYVAVGTMLVCGAPDLPHLAAVCAANDAKFPNAEAITDTHGKFQKPAGWLPPCHADVAAGLPTISIGFDVVTENLIKERCDVREGKATGLPKV